ncbi:hypothetical protein M8C21_019695, partial [Ambrosia artemisiifolia]
AMLLGANDAHSVDKDMRITLAFNWFSKCDQRLPRCRLGFFQIVNNDYEGWGTYAIGGSANPTILSHGNRFSAPPDPIKKNTFSGRSPVCMRVDAPEAEWKKWNWRSKQDVLLNGAIFVESGVDPSLTPEQKGGLIAAEPGERVPKLTSCAGVLSCVPGEPLLISAKNNSPFLAPEENSINGLPESDGRSVGELPKRNTNMNRYEAVGEERVDLRLQNVKVDRSRKLAIGLIGNKHNNTMPAECSETSKPIVRESCKHRLAQKLRNAQLGKPLGTTGGLGGEIYVVTDPSDADAANPKPGTLRAGVVQNKPLWITFAKDMVIKLVHELVINNDKTIDGRGAKVEIIGTGISMHSVKNIILHGINIHDLKPAPGGMIKSTDGPAILRQKTDGDGVCITGSSKIWIDHCSFSKGLDGLIDVTFKSTDVTISNCKFSDHHKILLFGAGDTHTVDKDMRVTLAFNWFAKGCDQRMPRCRFGCKPSVLVRADAPESEWKKWNWRSEKDALLNGAIFVPSGVDPPLTPEQKSGLIVAEPGESVPQLTSCAGVLSCVPGQPC